MYNLTAKQAMAEGGTELRDEVRHQIDEARVKLGNDRKNDLLCAWRIEATEDIAYFG